MDLPTCTIRAANDRGLSSLLDQAIREGAVVLTRHGTPVTVLVAITPEVSEAAAGGLAGQFERLGAAAWDEALEWAEHGEDGPAGGQSLSVPVSTANQRGITWMVQRAAETGLLALTRYREREVLVMSLHPDGLAALAATIRALAAGLERRATDRLERALEALKEDQTRAAGLRKRAQRVDGQIRPAVETLRAEGRTIGSGE